MVNHFGLVELHKHGIAKKVVRGRRKGGKGGFEVIKDNQSTFSPAAATRK